MEDINEQVTQQWIGKTTARERVKEILRETTEYALVRDIAARAQVSEPTARKYLTELVDENLAESTHDGRATVYKRNESTIVHSRIESLRTSHTREELIHGIREMKEAIDQFRAVHGVENPADLALELDSTDKRWEDVADWQATRQNLAVAKAALHVNEAHRLLEA